MKNTVPTMSAAELDASINRLRDMQKQLRRTYRADQKAQEAHREKLIKFGKTLLEREALDALYSGENLAQFTESALAAAKTDEARQNIELAREAISSAVKKSTKPSAEDAKTKPLTDDDDGESGAQGQPSVPTAGATPAPQSGPSIPGIPGGADSSPGSASVVGKRDPSTGANAGSTQAPVPASTQSSK